MHPLLKSTLFLHITDTDGLKQWYS